MSKGNLEDYLVECCSPTLAGIKCASLFSIACEKREELDRETQRFNHLCNPKGVALKVLRWNAGRALVYVYREKLLREILERPCVMEFLREYGYHQTGLEPVLNALSARICSSSNFPHEIGVFLGYPFEDVKGFIENEGKGCIFCGYWKVYCDERSSKRLFRRFDACKARYLRSYRRGMSVPQLTVAG